MAYYTQRILTICILLAGIYGSLFAQEVPVRKKEKYTYTMYTRVYQKRLMEKPDKVKDSVLMKLADSYYFIADYENAARVYEILFQRAAEKPEFDVPLEYNFRYGQSLRAIGKEDLAMEKLSDFLSEAEARAVMQTTRVYELQDLSQYFSTLKDSVNLSYFSDFAPVFYKEGLLFSSDRDTGSFHRYRHSGTNKDFLDLYQITPGEEEELLIKKVNFSGNGINPREAESTSIKVDESTATFSSDGKTMYFTASNFRDGDLVKDQDNIVRLKIFKAVLNEEGWQIAGDSWYRNGKGDKSFNADGYSFANPALSPDGSRLYFTSDMPGSKGLSDLFVVHVDESGISGEIKNLGDLVNTEFRESFPFVSKEGKLYFSSDRIAGEGRLDVYSVDLNAEGMVASVPENLGAPVNSPYDDFTFIYDSEKEYGFFASNRPRSYVSGSKTLTDESDNIYAFTAKCLNPKTLTGIVYDRVTELPLPGTTINIIDENNEVIASTFTNEEGAYEIPIDRTRNNFVRAIREGYTSTEEYLEINPCELRMVDFYIETNCVDYGTDLAKLLGLDPTIFFDFDKSVIRDDYKDELDIIVDAMILYPSLRIQVNSHTDARGDNDTYNQPLSERRAGATVDYIVSRGIDRDRLKYAGFGETQPVNECVDGVRCSAAKHQQNRRSEFLILCEEGENCCY